MAVSRMSVVHVFGGISPLFTLLSASWFGALVFYGDNVHRRCSFFADRGISPTRVWWTRLAPPAIACLVLIVSVVLVRFNVQEEVLVQLHGPLVAYMVLLAVLFAFGQLVSQWTQRPLLAFVAAPAYTAVSLLPVAYMLDRYHASFTVTLLSVPVLLLATWRLTGRWLDGKVQHGFTGRVLGYTLIAVLLPCLWIGVSDWARNGAGLIGGGIPSGILP
jgi:hypothetical protein